MPSKLLNAVKAIARIFRNRWALARATNISTVGPGFHVGANVRLWAPDCIEIGRNVYIGRDVHVECNLRLGDNVLIANRVSFVGRFDHDIREVGVPIRCATWIGDREQDDVLRRAKVEVGDDVWIGYGAVILTGVTIGRGAVIAAGAIVRTNIDSYAIAAGNPAVQIAVRFEPEIAERHEKAVREAGYQFSEWSGITRKLGKDREP